MDPEDSCLWIHGTEDQQTIAFTPAGMEYLRDLLAEHKRNRPPRGTERMVSACRRRCLKWRRRPSHSPSAAPPKSSGEDEQLLWELADEMHPENGCL